MNQHQFTLQEDRDHLSFFYDTRSQHIWEIQDFLASTSLQKLQQSIEERAYVVLGWDGLFVHVAKIAHHDNVAIIGINFGTKGFLLHDREMCDQEGLVFDSREYPILHTEIHMDDEHIHGYAFNEVYITRAGDAGSVNLSLSQWSKSIDSYRGDGLMISTPAGSTGWSRSYGGTILPHNANLNVLTPVGKIIHRDFQATVIPDKGRIRIKNDTKRINPIDILLDNRRIVSMETRQFEMTIERASRWVRLLIEKQYRQEWDKKPFCEIWFN